MSAIPSIKNVGAVGEATFIKMLAIPGVEDIRTVGEPATIKMTAIPSIEDIRAVGEPATIKVLTVPGVKDIGAVGKSTAIDMRTSHTLSKTKNYKLQKKEQSNQPTLEHRLSHFLIDNGTDARIAPHILGRLYHIDYGENRKDNSHDSYRSTLTCHQ